MRMWTNSGVWSRVAHPTSRALKMHLILFCDGCRSEFPVRFRRSTYLLLM
jgi:hypothetical protein